METGQLKIIDSIPWREAFPEYRKEDLPGVSLLGARTKEGINYTDPGFRVDRDTATAPFHDGTWQADDREEKCALAGQGSESGLPGFSVTCLRFILRRDERE
jgi:hypothetical protein